MVYRIQHANHIKKMQQRAGEPANDNDVPMYLTRRTGTDVVVPPAVNMLVIHDFTECPTTEQFTSFMNIVATNNNITKLYVDVPNFHRLVHTLSNMTTLLRGLTSFVIQSTYNDNADAWDGFHQYLGQLLAHIAMMVNLVHFSVAYQTDTAHIIISQENANMLAGVMRMPSLRSFHWMAGVLPDSAIDVLVDAAEQSTSLSDIHLHNIVNTCATVSYKRLVEIPRLQTLLLSGAAMFSITANLVFEALVSTSKLSRFTFSFDVSQFSSTICDQLKQLYKCRTRIIALDLSSCSFGNEVLYAIAENFDSRKQPGDSVLTHIGLANNNITVHGLTPLVDIIMKSNVTHIDLGNNRLLGARGHNGECTFLFLSLLGKLNGACDTHNSRLEHINLSNSNMNQRMGWFLQEAFVYLRHLRSIDFSNNVAMFPDHTNVPILHPSRNPSCNIANFSYNQLTDATLDIWIDADIFDGVKTLSLAHSHITRDSFVRILNSLSNSSTIIELDASSNRFGLECASEIATFIFTNKTVQVFRLGGLVPDDADPLRALVALRCIRHAVKNNKTLHVLVLRGDGALLADALETELKIIEECIFANRIRIPMPLNNI